MILNSYLASREEIKENEFNLNIPRYGDTFEEEEENDLQVLMKNREKLKAKLHDLEIVILHELCHEKEHNHGPKFWGLLKNTLPDYPERRTRLNTLLN